MFTKAKSNSDNNYYNPVISTTEILINSFLSACIELDQGFKTHQKSAATDKGLL